MAASKKKGTEKKRKRRPRSLARRNAKIIFRILPFIVPPLITVFMYTLLHTRTNIVALPIEDLRDQRAELVKRNDALRIKIEQLQAPRRIEAIARQKLGMISPNLWQIIVLDKPVQAPGAAVRLADSPEREESNSLLGKLRQRIFSAGTSAARLSPKAAGQPG